MINRLFFVWEILKDNEPKNGRLEFRNVGLGYYIGKEEDLHTRFPDTERTTFIFCNPSVPTVLMKDEGEEGEYCRKAYNKAVKLGADIWDFEEYTIYLQQKQEKDDFISKLHNLFVAQFEVYWREYQAMFSTTYQAEAFDRERRKIHNQIKELTKGYTMIVQYAIDYAEEQRGIKLNDILAVKDRQEVTVLISDFSDLCVDFVMSEIDFDELIENEEEIGVYGV